MTVYLKFNQNQMGKINHELALILKLAEMKKSESGSYIINDIIEILGAIEAELDKFDLTNAPLDAISATIHKLYTSNNPAIRGYLLRLIVFLECSQSTILEAFNFDKLIAMAFDHRPESPSSPGKADSTIPIQKDEEKIAALRNIALLIKLKRPIPDSILNSLISYYQHLSTNSTPANNSIRSLLVSYFCESTLYSPQQISSFPEIGQIIIDAMVTGNLGFPPTVQNHSVELIAGLINYSIENGSQFVNQKHLLSRAIEPFAKFTPGQNTVELANSIKGITRILETWPGILHAGFKLGLLSDLVDCLPHQPEGVVSILKNLLFLDNRTSIHDSHTGLLLYGLIKYDIFHQIHVTATKLIEKSKQEPSDSITMIITFLNSLLPFIGSDDDSAKLISTTSIDQLSPVLSQSNTKDSEQVNSFDSLAYQMGNTRSIVVIKSAKIFRSLLEKSDNDAAMSTELPKIYELLTFVLPQNEEEMNLDDMYKLYTKILRIYSNDISRDSAEPVSYSITRRMLLIALFKILTSEKLKTDILNTNKEFSRTVIYYAESIRDNKLTPDTAFSLFTALTVLTRTPKGHEYLINNHVADVLRTIGGSLDNKPCIKDRNIANEIIKIIDITQDLGIEKDMLLSFLLSKDEVIHQYAVNKVKSYQNLITNDPNFHFVKQIFSVIVVPFVLKTDFSEQSIDLLIEILTSDKNCLNDVIENQDFFKKLRNYSHSAYSLFFSRPESLSKTIEIDGNEVNAAEHELNYWMETGNMKYVDDYDKAVKNKAFIPPHIFGQLGKTEQGIEMAQKHLETLVRMLESERTKRAALFALAHFGSKPSSQIPDLLQKVKAIEAMFAAYKSSSSYSFKGTFLAALSMFEQSAYLQQVLDENHYHIFKFGTHSAVVPDDIENFIGKLEPFQYGIQRFSFDPSQPISSNNLNKAVYPDDDEDTKNKINDVLTTFLQLICPILSAKGRNHLKDLMQSTPAIFKRRELALYAHEIMTKFPMNSDNRFVIAKLFQQTPLFASSSVDYQYDQQQEAIVQAKLYQFENTNRIGKLLSEMQLQKYPASELKHGKICRLVPEVYLQDDEFESATGMSKEKFYALDEKSLLQARKKLLA